MSRSTSPRLRAVRLGAAQQPEHPTTTYVCGRCGIERECSKHKQSRYCADCKPHAEADGWIPRPTRRGWTPERRARMAAAAVERCTRRAAAQMAEAA